MLGEGRGTWAVAQTLILIPFFFCYIFQNFDILATFDATELKF